MTDYEWKTNVVEMIFSLSNRLQAIGDELDEKTTVKQRLFITGVSRFKEAPTLGELAKVLGCSRQNTKRMAVDLEKMGFVAISKDSNDARALRSGLTQKCAEHFEQLGDWAAGSLDTIFTGFDDDLAHSVYKGLLRLAHNTDLLTKANGTAIPEAGS